MLYKSSWWSYSEVYKSDAAQTAGLQVNWDSELCLVTAEQTDMGTVL